MSPLVGGVAAGVVVCTLLLAVVEHLSAPASLARALAQHRVLPAPAVLAAAAIATEALLAGSGVVALINDESTLLTATLAGAAALFAGYGSYGAHVWLSRRPGSCGCSRLPTPTTGWVVARAFALAAVALLAAVLSGVAPDAVLSTPAAFGPALIVVLLAAAVFTSLLWSLPAAMREPDWHGEPVGASTGGDMSGGRR